MSFNEFNILLYNLYLYFNDTIDTSASLEKVDIELTVYGPKSPDSYHFDYSLEFFNNNTVFVQTQFQSSLNGANQELISVRFVNRDKFKSVFSLRGVNPQEITGHLYKFEGVQVSSKSLGQTAMIVFLASIALSFLSSFGGNSMEVMWNFMNTLQLMYFLSFVYVQFPDYVEDFFSYLSYSNLENQYSDYFAKSLISENNFKRGNVNDRIGPKAFYTRAADDLPLLFSLIVLFVISLTSDFFKLRDRGKCCKFVFKLFDFLKYNFFLRFGTEMFLELQINALVGLRWADFSTTPEIVSSSMAIVFMSISLFLVMF